MGHQEEASDNIELGHCRPLEVQPSLITALGVLRRGSGFSEIARQRLKEPRSIRRFPDEEAPWP